MKPTNLRVAVAGEQLADDEAAVVARAVDDDARARLPLPLHELADAAGTTRATA